MNAANPLLSAACLERILERIPRLTVGVIGDLFLDRYLDIDAALTEPSLETGLDAYQVVRVRSHPGAAGTVINNLVAFGIGSVCAVAAIGDDGEGYELRQALERQQISSAWLHRDSSRRTPTYTKPMLHGTGQTPRELNRLDIKNRQPLPRDAEEAVLASLAQLWPRLDALIVVDQVSEAGCGVITERVRQRLAELGAHNPGPPILADSRERIGLFRSLWLKPNERECLGAVGKETTDVESCARELARCSGRPVFCTRGARGMFVVDPRPESRLEITVPAVPVTGPIDPVGAGDSTSAALACALAANVSLPEAALFANLVASITIQQIGTTGTASPEQIRRQHSRAFSPAPSR
jgi:rfaE bifunctional protein kinase chain/domain